MTTRGIAGMVRHVDQFQRRCIQDAVADAMAEHWLRRAAQFEAARPRPGDYNGRATPTALSSRSRRLTAIAAACRARAELIRLVGLWDDEMADVDTVLEEVA